MDVTKCCVICRKLETIEDVTGHWDGINYVCSGCVDDAENLHSFDGIGEWAVSEKACDPGCPGWAVFNGCDLQRCDECKRFGDDDDACEHVRRLYESVTCGLTDRAIFRRASPPRPLFEVGGANGVRITRTGLQAIADADPGIADAVARALDGDADARAEVATYVERAVNVDFA